MKYDQKEQLLLRVNEGQGNYIVALLRKILINAGLILFLKSFLLISIHLVGLCELVYVLIIFRQRGSIGLAQTIFAH